MRGVHKVEVAFILAFTVNTLFVGIPQVVLLYDYRMRPHSIDSGLLLLAASKLSRLLCQGVQRVLCVQHTNKSYKKLDLTLNKVLFFTIRCFGESLSGVRHVICIRYWITSFNCPLVVQLI